MRLIHSRRYISSYVSLLDLLLIFQQRLLLYNTPRGNHLIRAIHSRLGRSTMLLPILLLFGLLWRQSLATISTCTSNLGEPFVPDCYKALHMVYKSSSRTQMRGMTAFESPVRSDQPASRGGVRKIRYRKGPKYGKENLCGGLQWSYRKWAFGDFYFLGDRNEGLTRENIYLQYLAG